MAPFVQNTGIALLAKTTIAQVRPIHSSIGLNKDMRVWEQINTSNVLNPPTPPCNQPLNITWWPFDGLDLAGDPNRKTIPILLFLYAQRWDQVWVFAFSICLSLTHPDLVQWPRWLLSWSRSRISSSWHWREVHVQCGERRWSRLSGSHHTTRIRARALSCNMYVCTPFQRLAFTNNAQSSSNLSNILLFFLSFL